MTLSNKKNETNWFPTIERCSRTVISSSWKKDIFDVYSRLSLPLLMNKLELYGMGVEVGVLRGSYSNHLLKHSNLSTLYSIDPWEHFDEDKYMDINNVSQKKHDENYIYSFKRLCRFGSRSVILRMKSMEALSEFEDSSLDFVYLDAVHSYEMVSEDLVSWSKKVRIGGMIAGHDYIDDGVYYDLPGQGIVWARKDLSSPVSDTIKNIPNITENKLIFGVKSAVNEFVEKHNYTLHVTKAIRFPSWFFIKTH